MTRTRRLVAVGALQTDEVATYIDTQRKLLPGTPPPRANYTLIIAAALAVGAAVYLVSKAKKR